MQLRAATALAAAALLVALAPMAAAATLIRTDGPDDLRPVTRGTGSAAIIREAADAYLDAPPIVPERRACYKQGIARAASRRYLQRA